MSRVLHLSFAGPTPEQVAEMDTDIANTALSARWHRENYRPLSSDDDRALEERLSISVRMCDWRRKADLPPLPPRAVVMTWRRHLQLLWALGGYRRRHPNVSPISTPRANPATGSREA